VQGLAFWKAVTVDRSHLLERFVHLLRTHDVPFCVIGGQAVNAYVEPVVSLDLDVVIAADRVAEVRGLMAPVFHVETVPLRLKIAAPHSDLRVQIQLDPRYADVLDRAAPHDVLGLTLPVASVDDVLRGKVWAVEDPGRRASKRQKDLADIARLLEHYPRLRPSVPRSVLDRLI
jgi:hypothetical protein